MSGARASSLPTALPFDKAREVVRPLDDNPPAYIRTGDGAWHPARRTWGYGLIFREQVLATKSEGCIREASSSSAFFVEFPRQ